VDLDGNVDVGQACLIEAGAELAAEVGSPGPHGAVRFENRGAPGAAPDRDNIGREGGRAHGQAEQCRGEGQAPVYGRVQTHFSYSMG
jgi:hypothetical protein